MDLLGIAVITVIVVGLVVVSALEPEDDLTREMREDRMIAHARRLRGTEE